MRREIRDLVHAPSAGEVFTPIGGLPPVGSWCGGPEFPDLVAEHIAPRLPSRAARAANAAVEAMVLAEDDSVLRPVHGDLGMHNIFWVDEGRVGANRPRISALIDLDHAALADPAIDIAPLVGQFGASALAEITPSATLERALLHRATLSLQVACAAEVVGDNQLRDFALDTFTKRLGNGTLHDPDGARSPRTRAASRWWPSAGQHR